MPQRIYVDTGAFIALADRSDQYHEAAQRIVVSLPVGSELVTTDYILVEVSAYLHNHISYQVARRFWRSLRLREVDVALEWATPEDLDRAWAIAVRYPDQDFSLVDCVSFAVMERLGIATAFSFDSHFDTYRSSLGPIVRLYAP